ncbi:KLTH0C10450p [Lachancea thermotolerans CBS 6340]|uniref:KLTH0C10450p n=1 Tax=Lachancea thermotolerans (strain ATCC 56472 / CBS 6340 / NRRL Y-8284) TaxID=559295 RepID=C5DEM5_LACTC|nr:KLTH0C10450p [Lachancea thermotolerans CBS 6340]CAR22236.1 KLTH0C10450p [Lachancea thermotolerans CBS 6340]
MTSDKKVSKAIPITLLSGFLGSGKTTLLEKILTTNHGFKIAVIINDMSELNIDSSLVQAHNVCQKEEKLIELQNGCICCTLRGDLLEELVGIGERGEFDYIVIESTGIAEPMQVAETFSVEFSDILLETPGGIPENEEKLLRKVSDMGGLQAIAKLDTCVTVIDALNFLSNIQTTEFLADRWGENGQGEAERTITDLMVDQIEFSDVIIVNKKSMVSKKKLKEIKKMVKILNPVAKVIATDYCNVPLSSILDTKLHDFEKASLSAGWLQSINEMTVRDGFGNKGSSVLTPKPETEEYGVNNFVYRRRRPFHPERLYDLIRDKFFVIEQAGAAGMDEEEEDDEEESEEQSSESEADSEMEAEVDEGARDGEEKEEEEGEEYTEEEINKNRANSPFGKLLRSKGFFWLATRFVVRGEWSSAGPMLTLNGGLPWFAVSGLEDVPEEALELVKKDYEGEFGDRRNELVFIGLDINEKLLSEALDSCLLTDKEYKRFKNITSKHNALVADEKLSKVWDDGFEDWIIMGAGDEEEEDREQEEEQEEEEEEEGKERSQKSVPMEISTSKGISV